MCGSFSLSPPITWEAEAGVFLVLVALAGAGILILVASFRGPELEVEGSKFTAGVVGNSSMGLIVPTGKHQSVAFFRASSGELIVALVGVEMLEFSIALFVQRGVQVCLQFLPAFLQAQFFILHLDLGLQLQQRSSVWVGMLGLAFLLNLGNRLVVFCGVPLVLGFFRGCSMGANFFFLLFVTRFQGISSSVVEAADSVGAVVVLLLLVEEGTTTSSFSTISSSAMFSSDLGAFLGVERVS